MPRLADSGGMNRDVHPGARGQVAFGQDGQRLVGLFDQAGSGHPLEHDEQAPAVDPREPVAALVATPLGQRRFPLPGRGGAGHVVLPVGAALLILGVPEGHALSTPST